MSSRSAPTSFVARSENRRSAHLIMHSNSKTAPLPRLLLTFKIPENSSPLTRRARKYLKNPSDFRLSSPKLISYFPKSQKWLPYFLHFRWAPIRHQQGGVLIAILNHRRREALVCSEAGISVPSHVFCLGRDRATALGTVITAIGILLIAAAIAALVTFVPEWKHTAYIQSKANVTAEGESRPKDIELFVRPSKIAKSSLSDLESINGPFGFALARDLEIKHASIATSTAAAVSLLGNSFAHGDDLLFLPEPVGSEALWHRQTSEFIFATARPATDLPTTDLVDSTQLLAKTLSDEYNIEVPLPRARPIIDHYIRAQNDASHSNRITATSKIQSGASQTASFAPFTFFLKKLFRFGQAQPMLPPEADSRTAVYDIERHVVYLPTGEKLEAHSGLGKWLDDVRYVNAKNRGPTPPNIYRLALRKELFHGVRAIRLNPIGGGTMYGREGMLAHPYMLGPNGESNGCVSLREYPKFLEAFQRGDIDRLIVVAQLGTTSSRAARAHLDDEKQYALK